MSKVAYSSQLVSYNYVFNAAIIILPILRAVKLHIHTLTMKKMPDFYRSGHIRVHVIGTGKIQHFKDSVKMEFLHL